MAIKKPKIKNCFLVLITIVFLSSCQENSLNINPNNLLLGNWSNATFDGEKTIFNRVNNLPSDSYGISFKDEDVFIERSSGFCGTPPLTFFNVDGTWTTNNNLIEVNKVGNPSSFMWKIISLNEKELIVKRELTEQEKDHQNLISLFNDIERLAYSVTCSNSTDWTFTNYGSKACGGPQGYIAYSNQIDTVEFLQKINDYTEKERLYNIKWGIISTCDIPKVPISVECNNSFPVLKY